MSENGLGREEKFRITRKEGVQISAGVLLATACAVIITAEHASLSTALHDLNGAENFDKALLGMLGIDAVAAGATITSGAASVANRFGVHTKRKEA